MFAFVFHWVIALVHRFLNVYIPDFPRSVKHKVDREEYLARGDLKRKCYERSESHHPNDAIEEENIADSDEDESYIVKHNHPGLKEEGPDHALNKFCVEPFSFNQRESGSRGENSGLKPHCFTCSCHEIE